MEDSSLDDFFAKKDKSKKKSKAAKFTTGDILDKQTDGGDKPKKSKKKSDKNSSNQTSGGSSTKGKEDDEWADYVEEAEKDFSDLKIANLQVGSRTDEDDVEKGGDVSGSENEDGEGRERREVASGPWNKAAPNPSVEAPAPEIVPEPQPPPKEEAPKTTGKYIPPAARRAMESGSGGSTGGGLTPYHGHRSRKTKEAPNVNSELDFPTLGGASMADTSHDMASVGSVAPARFEQVRGGGRHTEDPRGQAGKVEVGNKFDALLNADA